MLGQQIKEVRKEEKVTQEELAKRINTSKSVISAIENGKRNISFFVLEKIARALNRIVANQILVKP